MAKRAAEALSIARKAKARLIRTVSKAFPETLFMAWLRHGLLVISWDYKPGNAELRCEAVSKIIRPIVEEVGDRLPDSTRFEVGLCRSGPCERCGGWCSVAADPQICWDCAEV
jgi:hypothetical protein